MQNKTLLINFVDRRLKTKNQYCLDSKKNFDLIKTELALHVH